MTPPWPQPAPVPPAGRAERPAGRLGSLAGWLALLAGALLAVLALSTTWASGELGGASVELDVDRLLDVEDAPYPVTVVLLHVGLVTAAAVGVAALPATRAQRWLVSALLVVPAVGLVVAESLPGRSSSPPWEVALIGLVIFGIPVGIVLLLVWRGARRGAAVTALVCAVVGALAHLVTVGWLVAAPAEVAGGAWLALGAALLGVAGAVLLERTTPRRRWVGPRRPVPPYGG